MEKKHFLLFLKSPRGYNEESMTYTFIDKYRPYSSVHLYLYNGDDRKYSNTKFNS
jgi:hypothetical protein